MENMLQLQIKSKYDSIDDQLNVKTVKSFQLCYFAIHAIEQNFTFVTEY